MSAENKKTNGDWNEMNGNGESGDEKEDVVKEVPKSVVDENGDPIVDSEDAKADGKEENEEEEASDLEEGEYEVERILDVGVRDGNIKYLVRWKGYDSDEDSWEPEGNLGSARLVLDEYIATHADLVQKQKEKLEAMKAKHSKRGRKKVTPDKPVSRTSSRRSMRNKEDHDESDDNASDDEEDKKKKKKTAKGRGSIHEEEPEDAENSEDEDFTSAKRKSNRGRKSLAERRSRTKGLIKFKLKRDEPVVKELSPRNAKNAWLYDDADDMESDDSGAANKAKPKETPEVREPETTKALKRSKRTLENAGVSPVEEVKKKTRHNSPDESKDSEPKPKTEESQDSGKKRKGNRSSCSGRQDDVANSTSADPDSLDWKTVSKNVSVEFLGMVRLKDKSMRVICKKEGENCLLTIKEAFGLNAYSLVEFFVERCDFEKPGVVD